MRILVAQPGPYFSVQDVYIGWVEALRELGAHVVEFNLNERLTFYEAAAVPTPERNVFRRALKPEQAIELAANGIYAALYKVRPDVLVVVSGFFLPPDVYVRARDYGTKVVILHTEEPYEHERELGMAPFVDLHVLNDPTNLADFEALAPAVYIPHCYRPSLHTPGPAVPELVSDFAFVGTGYPSRMSFFEAMNLDGLDVVLAGNWEGLPPSSPLSAFVSHEPDQCLDNDMAVDVYRSAKVGINTYRRDAIKGGHADGWAMGPREVEMAACQLFFMREPRGEGDAILDMLPTFDGPEDASEKLRWWLNHDEERLAMAQKAREAIGDRTFANAAAKALTLLES